MDQGSNKNHSPAYNFTPTVTKFCVMWEGLSLPHDTKFGNCRCKIVDSRSFHSWSLIHGLCWSGLIKVGPGWMLTKICDVILHIQVATESKGFPSWAPLNTLRPRQNGRHFADDTFNRIFVNENVRIFIKFSLKFVPKGPINNIPTLVQIMAWRRPGDKPLSEPVMVSLLTHIRVTRPQWVNNMVWL